MRNERPAGVLVNLALLGLSVALSTLLAVGVFTFVSMRRMQTRTDFHNPNTRFDVELGWAPVPGSRLVTWKNKQVSSNRAGFRSPEVNPGKGHIVIVGDSVVWGFKVNDDETVSRYLQDAVDAGHGDLQVLNLGVPGYGIDQYHLWLRRNLEMISPLRAVVVVITTSNDWRNTGANFAYGKSKPLFVLGPGGGLLNVNPRISKYSLLNLTSTWNLPQWAESLLEPSYGTREVSEEELKNIVSALFAEMEKLAANRQAKLLFVLSPYIDDLGAKETSGLPLFRQLLAAGGHDVLDFKEYLLKTEQNPRAVYRDPVHYNPQGHRRLAEAIFERLSPGMF